MEMLLLGGTPLLSAMLLPYASTWQRQESGPECLFSITLLLCPG